MTFDLRHRAAVAAKAARTRAPIHGMRPNTSRILAAIAYVIEEGQRQKKTVTQYDIVKTLFLADKASLNKFGRPITFDNYVAMKDGPVPSTAYNFLKSDERVLRVFHVKHVPWRCKSAPEFGDKAMSFSIDEGKVSTDALSPSDIEELKNAFTVVKSLGFREVRKLTHEHPAYVDAWDPEGSKKGYSMSYSLLFDVPNAELAEELSFLSKHV